ncbi:chemotaxis protein CheW [Candidatus Sororendozoicomonas aggregata]|uniref:chemotaxis protein CheW n=1 Tax=Candidatus Sororendozoicomonas aggregata TaxID=3073239 RepID=UPI002ED11A54
MTPSVPHPFDLLSALEKKALEHTCVFPEKESVKAYWSGVKFRLNDQQFVMDSREITEVLPVPEVTPLPDVHSWVKGLANVRGRILPMIDLGGFLGRNEPLPSIRNRVIVVDQRNISLGLIVDEVQGMKQFSVASDEQDIPENLALAVRPFINGCYYKEVHHMVFSTDLLVKNQRFLKAAKGV